MLTTPECRLNSAFRTVLLYKDGAMLAVAGALRPTLEALSLTPYCRSLHFPANVSYILASAESPRLGFLLWH
jgi:hypothetical protein